MASADGIKTNGFNKQKTKAFLAEWEKIEEWAASEIGKIAQKTRDKKEEVLDAAESIGINKSVFRKVAKEAKLLRQADEIRGTIDDPDKVDQFDNVKLAAGMTLFDAAGVETPPAKKPQPSGKVPPAKGGPKKGEVVKDVHIQDGAASETTETIQ